MEVKMEKIKQYLNYIALALIFISIIFLRIWPHKKTIALIIGVVGVAALAAYIILNISSLKQGFKRRSFIYSSNMIVVVVLVIGILVIINYFFARHHHRFDFTEAKLHSLSDQSVKILKNLKNDVHIMSFFLEGNFRKNEMENLLQNYAYHSKKIKYEFIDPDKNPGMVKRYDVTTDGTTILESGDKESRITTSTEEDLTNAIVKVSRERKKVLYFLEGHGEASIEDSEERGYSLAKQELEKLAYEVKKLPLALADNFPEDCSLLVIPGAQKDLVPNELETIRNFISKGGRVFFMVDPETAPGLKSFIAEYGIQLEDDLIVDTVSRLMGGDYFMPVVTGYEFHPITEKFNFATFFPFARSINETEVKPAGVITTTLAKTSTNSWSERQLTEKEVTFNEEKDVAGPLSIAAVVTVETKEEKPEEQKEEEAVEEKEAILEEELEESPTQEGRLAVFGDSDFATNRYYYLSGNGNLFLNTINWLAEEADLISIQAKTASPRIIQLTATQGRILFFVSVIILPLVVLVAGITVWVRRRSL
jgi:ABC-type uncharacterized transport system involved in gliding motility auxiliary subunit